MKRLISTKLKNIKSTMLTMATIFSGLAFMGQVSMAAPVSLTSNMIPNAGSYGVKPPADSSFELTQEYDGEAIWVGYYSIDLSKICEAAKIEKIRFSYEVSGVPDPSVPIDGDGVTSKAIQFNPDSLSTPPTDVSMGAIYSSGPNLGNQMVGYLDDAAPWELNGKVDFDIDVSTKTRKEIQYIALQMRTLYHAKSPSGVYAVISLPQATFTFNNDSCVTETTNPTETTVTPEPGKGSGGQQQSVLTTPAAETAKVNPPNTGAKLLFSLILIPMAVGGSAYSYIAYHNKSGIKKKSER
jgi:hypothetical protein